MIKDFINSIKLSRLSYLLEIIEVRDFRSKIKAYNKIHQMKLTKEMGLLILDEVDFERHSTYSDFNICMSLISLLFVDYYDEYSNKLKDIYPKLTIESKYELLSLLASSSSKSAIILYKDLVLKYGKELDNFPIGTLGGSKDNYKLLFPDLFKAFKYDIKRNNLILLLGDFFNYGVVKENDVRKNKKVIADSITKVLREGVNYKFKKDENIMQNSDYINLRLFLETIMTIEFYISTKDTKNYLEKLLKKKDNQLKLFILENYVKKGKDISKINLNTIARDNLSRNPLYSFLMFYNLERLMPKKYSNNLSLSESDLFISFSINNKYEVLPENIEFVEERIVNDYKYFIYKFETDFNYSEEVKDPATDYILKNTSIDKKLVENTKVKYIGISGGFNKDLDPSLIEKNLNTVSFKKYDGDYAKVIEDLLPKKEIPINLDIIKEKKDIFKEKLPKNNIFKNKFNFKKKEKTVKVKVNKTKVKKEKKIKIKDEKIVVEERELSILRKIFSFNTLLVIVCITLLLGVYILYSYVNGNDILDLKKNTANYDNLVISKSSVIESDKYKEISYENIFKQPEKEYYVILYNKKKKSVYHNYIKTLLDNNYVIYYVNTNKEENKKIFEGNPTGFVIKDDTLLKVNDKEYEFFVVGKTNILKEFRDYIEIINEKNSSNEKES